MKRRVFLCFVALLFASSSFALETEDYLRMLSPLGQKENKQVRTRGIAVGTVALDSDRDERPVTAPEIAMHLNFEKGSAVITSASQMELQKLADALSSNALRDYKFRLEGHTCDLGSASSNLALSKRRAANVAQLLAQISGLSPSQFDVIGYGETSPTVPNVDEAARRENRRVIVRNTLATVNTGTIKKKSQLQHSVSSATMQIFRYGKEQNQLLKDGETLQSGDNYTVLFSPGKHRYAYLCQIDTAGVVNVLFPDFSQQKNPVTPQKSYRIPKAGNYFTLDKTVGKEQFILLTIDQELTNPKKACRIAMGKKNEDNTIATRGIGGITSGTSLPQEKSSVTENIFPAYLCDGGTLQNTVTTRGIAGVTNTAKANHSSTMTEQCSGMVTMRSFIHQ